MGRADSEGKQMRAVRFFIFTLSVLVMAPGLALAADRGKLEDFLEVTGFDVALESTRLSASSAPDML